MFLVFQQVKGRVNSRIDIIVPLTLAGAGQMGCEASHSNPDFLSPIFLGVSRAALCLLLPASLLFFGLRSVLYFYRASNVHNGLNCYFSLQ